MSPIDIIISIAVILILGAAIFYIIRAKKKGAKCIGCPDSYTCAAKENLNGEVSGTGTCGGCCSGCKGCSHTNTEL